MTKHLGTTSCPTKIHAATPRPAPLWRGISCKLGRLMRLCGLRLGLSRARCHKQSKRLSPPGAELVVLVDRESRCSKSLAKFRERATARAEQLLGVGNVKSKGGIVVDLLATTDRSQLAAPTQGTASSVVFPSLDLYCNYDYPQRCRP